MCSGKCYATTLFLYIYIEPNLEKHLNIRSDGRYHLNYRCMNDLLKAVLGYTNLAIFFISA